MTDDLVGRLRKGRLIQAAESHVITIGGKTSIASTGETRELPHPDALEAAARIEALEAEKAEWLGIMRHLVDGRGRDLARAIIAKEDANVRP